MPARPDSPEPIARGQDRVRGETAADPSLLDDPERYRELAARVAGELAGDDGERQKLERALVAMRDQLREAGS